MFKVQLAASAAGALIGGVPLEIGCHAAARTTAPPAAGEIAAANQSRNQEQGMSETVTPFVRVEHQIVTAMIRVGSQWNVVVGELDAYGALGERDRELLAAAAEAVRPQVQRGIDHAIDPEWLRLLCFVAARSNGDKGGGDDWRALLAPSYELRRALHDGVMRTGCPTAMGGYLDAPAPHVELIHRHAARFGIAPPEDQELASTVRFIDLLRRAQSSLPEEERWRRYAALGQEDVDRIVEMLLSLQPTQRLEFVPMQIVAAIAATGPERLAPHAERLLAGPFRMPGILGLAADERVKERLFAGELPHPHLMLPWAGGGDVVRWANQPDENGNPRWTIDAGWEVGPGGERRDLFLPRAFTLERPSDDRAAADAPVRACVTGDYVGGGLFLDADLTDERTAMLGLARDRLRIPFVLSLDTDTDDTVYFDIDENGLAVPRGEHHPEYMEYAGGWTGELVLGRERVTPYETYRSAYITPKSQFGGCPSWEQGPYFPGCPKCERSMPCIAQIDLHEVGAVGFVHLYLCAGCETAAAAYECD